MKRFLQITSLILTLAIFSSCGAGKPWREITLGTPTSTTQETTTADNTSAVEEQPILVVTTTIQPPPATASMPPPPTIAHATSTPPTSIRPTTQTTATSLATNVAATTIVVTSTQFIPTTVTPTISITTTPTSTYRGLHFVDPPSKVYAGQIIELAIQGMPDTTYTIYGFHLADNSWLNPYPDSLYKTSDEDGRASWSWRLDANSAKGPTAIRVEGGGEFTTLYFAVM